MNMNNYLELGIWAITGIALVLSIIMGLARGGRRATLRLVLVFVCAVATFLLKGIVTDTVMTMNITINDTTTTIQQYVLEMLPEEMQQLGESVVLPLVSMIINVVVFLALFWALKLLSWIILYPICKIFVKKGAKKHAGFGALIGLVQGVVIALCFCVPISGMVVQMNKVVPIVEQLGATEANVEQSDTDGEDGSGESSIIPEEIEQMMSDYEQSAIGTFYGKTCQPLFDLICKVKIQAEDGTSRDVTLSGQIEALDAMLKIVNEVSETTDILGEIDFSDLKSFSDLKETFEKLDAITEDLPDEAKSTINEVIAAAIDMVPVPDDAEDSVKDMVTEVKEVLKNSDFTDIKFTKELEIIENLTTTIDKGEAISVEDISATINSVSESELLIPVLDSIDTSLTLDPTTVERLEKVFAELPEDTNQETVSTLKKLLGLSVDTAK